MSVQCAVRVECGWVECAVKASVCGVCRVSLTAPSSLPHFSPLPLSSSTLSLLSPSLPPSSPVFSTPSPSSVQRLGELFRKLWNPRNFKAHVSPHEMLQAVASTSKKRFKITEQGGCV